MGKRIILAVAGAGKTYELCRAIDPKKRNLIIAYTHENVKNIINNLYKIYNYIPINTMILTFDAFVYRYMINPYMNTIKDFYNEPNCFINGITTNPPPEKSIKLKNGSYKKNFLYVEKGKLNHYISKTNKLYNDLLADLLLSVKNKNINLLKKITNNLNLFFDKILIDEFQDFRKERYKLIIEMSKYFNDILLVGDYYQHSVLATNNSGIPFHKNISYNTFIQELKNNKFEVDDTSMNKSRRCSKKVCEFVQQKLKINFYSFDDHDGDVIIIRNYDFAKKIIENNSIIKLVYNDSIKKQFNAINWSYSKGDTFEDVCVILNDNIDEIINDNFDESTIKSQVIKNKLYVALTRPKRNLYIITNKLYKELQNTHQENISLF